MSSEKQLLAAIDIGSNAIRMVVAEYSQQGLKTLKKYRLPIRLGADVFDTGNISAKNLEESAHTFTKFKELTEMYKVSRIRAIGTSAMREAKNQQQFIDLMKSKSGITVEVVDGTEEANFIYLAVKNEVHLDQHNALLIDIGGGSVELTFSKNAQMTDTESFPVGTVRTLEMMKKNDLSEDQLPSVMHDFLKPLTKFIQSKGSDLPLDFAIGTGGNIDALGKLKPLLLKATSRTFLTLTELQQIIEKLKTMTQKERCDQLDFRPDRADVIVPAAMTVETVMKKAQLKKLLIPHVGMKDGILWSMVYKT